MKRAFAALLIAAALASCAAQDRPSPTTGGFEQAPMSPNPATSAQPPDNYP